MCAVESIPLMERVTTRLLNAGVNARANVLLFCTSTTTNTTTAATIYRYRF